MASIPNTSVALLRAIAQDTNSVRWEEFYSRYQPAMSAYLSSAFPSLEQEDVIQEAMIAFMAKVADYKYDPVNKGLFRNYLIGILKFKAIEALKKRKKESDKRDGFKAEIGEPVCEGRAVEKDDLLSWRQVVAEMSIRKLMADDSISTQNKEIFRRVAIKGESAMDVAGAFGVTRNNVDQIKARLTKRLREIIIEMGCLDGCDN